MTNMVAQLTLRERQLAIIILLLVSFAGLAMAAAGRADPIGAHGVIVMVASIGLIFVVLAAFYAPELRGSSRKPRRRTRSSTASEPPRVGTGSC